MTDVLIWNNDSECYEAKVEGELISVDGDVYSETRAEFIKTYAEEEGYVIEKVGDLPEEVYERLYEKAESDIEAAVFWTADMDGVEITPLA